MSLFVAGLYSGALFIPVQSVHALESTNTPLEEKLKHRPSVDEVARQISQKLAWRILAAEPTVQDNKTLYRFKLLDKKRGRVQIIIIDPDEMPDLDTLK